MVEKEVELDTKRRHLEQVAAGVCEKLILVHEQHVYHIVSLLRRLAPSFSVVMTPVDL